jgi:hypothetical protein
MRLKIGYFEDKQINKFVLFMHCDPQNVQLDFQLGINKNEKER